MNLPFFIARKYFFSRKISNVIHFISLISLVGVMVGSFALIVVLSVFNGFEEVVLSLYESFDPDLKVEPHQGKYFNPDEAAQYKAGQDLLEEIKSWKGVQGATWVIEENAMIKHGNDQTIATVKGIDPLYLRSMGLDSMVFSGQPIIQKGNASAALIGSGIAGKLNLSIYDQLTMLQIYIPKKDNPSIMLNPEAAFNKKPILTAGVFSVQQEFDEKYVVVPLQFMRSLVEEKHRVTGLEVNADDEYIEPLRDKLKATFGKDFVVKDRYQQHKWLYKIMKSEKLSTYMILSFILLIAAFNLIGALLMLAIEKKKDMAVLKSMGAPGNTIRNIFFFEGLILSISGAIIGIGLGTLVCWLQVRFELIKIKPGSTFVLDAYPVAFKTGDFILVFITVIVLGLIASYYPAYTAYKQIKTSDLNN